MNSFFYTRVRPYLMNYLRSFFTAVGLCTIFFNITIVSAAAISGKPLMQLSGYLSIACALYIGLAVSMLPSQFVFAQRAHRLPLWWRRILYSLYGIIVIMASMLLFSGVDSLREHAIPYIIGCTAADIIFTVIAFICIDFIERRRLRDVNDALKKINK